MIGVALSLLISLGTGARGAQGRQAHDRDITTRIIDLPVTLRLPVDNCTVPGVAMFIARKLRIPAGIENLPGCTFSEKPPNGDSIPLRAMTVADAMNTLVGADARYYWTESDGVIVVRPLAAWTDARHFLHVTTNPLHLDKANIGEALSAAVAALLTRPDRGQSALIASGVEEITLDTGPLSVVEALNAIVRANGNSYWRVEYCRGERLPQFATIWINTFDDRGLGTPLGSWTRDASGKAVDPCRAPQ